MTTGNGRGRLLRPDQVAGIMNCGRSSVYRLLAEAQLTGARVRGSVRVWESSIFAYLERQTELFALEFNDSVSDSSVVPGSLDGGGGAS